jgi:uncharacterized protein YegL
MMRLPVYLLIDTSASLGLVIDDLNTGLQGFVDDLQINPRTAEIVLVSIISFSDNARKLVSMEEPGDFQLPILQASGATNYGSALRLLKQSITQDVESLHAANERVLRPVVFFITDGRPVDPDWSSAVYELHDSSFRYRPTVIAIGFGTADPVILRSVAGRRGHVFLVAETVPFPRAIASIFEGLTGSLQSTVISSGSATDSIQTPLPREWINVSDDDSWI